MCAVTPSINEDGRNASRSRSAPRRRVRCGRDCDATVGSDAGARIGAGDARVSAQAAVSTTNTDEHRPTTRSAARPGTGAVRSAAGRPAGRRSCPGCSRRTGSRDRAPGRCRPRSTTAAVAGPVVATTAKGSPMTSEQGPQQPQDRGGVAVGSRVGRDGQRECEQRQQQQDEVRPGLPPWAESRRRPVGVAVGEQEQHLEEQGARAPHGRRTAVRRQDQLRDQWLHDEQETGSDEGGRREQHRDQP